MIWFKNLKVRSKLLISFTIVILLAAATGTYIILGMNAVNESYEQAMDITGHRISYIFAADDHYASARMITRELYNPDNTNEDLDRLSAELNLRLNELEASLNGLYTVEAPAVQEKIAAILPLIEEYRSDAGRAIGILHSAGEISPDNAQYREAMEVSEAVMTGMAESYADELSVTIEGFSVMAVNTLQTLAAENNSQAHRVLYISLTLFAVVASCSFAIAFWIPSLISAPLKPLAAFMKKAGSTGDISLNPGDREVIGKFSRFKDEIGETIQGASSFIMHVTNISEELKAVADGDLTVDISQLSEDDTMAGSIKHTLDSLNNMFSEIRSTTDQVASGSKQIASGSQTLAQGSTQQAASIQELSSAVANIAQKTRENAETAERTSILSEQIKISAERGSRQMDEMITAVKDINEASQSISKIIKTIDDIAFQTNILALNAAVEAARAGQHGKGFAVVAEEVRNLAAKSAQAAKETGDMIQNSMNKAEFGSSVASETANSLTEIVAGINESSQYINEIARASENQSLGISQINTGIDQVAQVVSQNSATAQESAAASEQMSSQAAVLEELLSLFKIKDSSSKSIMHRTRLLAHPPALG